MSYNLNGKTPWKGANAMGPAIHNEAGFRFSFVMGDLKEDPHVHVFGSSGTAKVWLSPVKLEWVNGLTRAEISKIMDIIQREQEDFLEKWREARARAGYTP